MVGNGAIVPGAWVCCKQSKLEVGLGTRLHARVGMLALFQNKVYYAHCQIATSIDSCPDPLTCEPD